MNVRANDTFTDDLAIGISKSSVYGCSHMAENRSNNMRVIARRDVYAPTKRSAKQMNRIHMLFMWRSVLLHPWWAPFAHNPVRIAFLSKSKNQMRVCWYEHTVAKATFLLLVHSFSFSQSVGMRARPNDKLFTNKSTKISTLTHELVHRTKWKKTHTKYSVGERYSFSLFLPRCVCVCGADFNINAKRCFLSFAISSLSPGTPNHIQPNKMYVIGWCWCRCCCCWCLIHL